MEKLTINEDLSHGTKMEEKKERRIMTILPPKKQKRSDGSLRPTEEYNRLLTVR
jgi:hypothetical protein